MFESSYKSQYIGGQKEKFVRLDDLDSNCSMPSSSRGMKKLRFNLDSLPIPLPGRGRKRASKSFRLGMKKSSDGLKTFGRSLKTGVTTWAVFPEDLKVSEKKVFDPQDKNLLYWNKFFEILCIVSIACDPFFFYLPYFNHKSFCLAIDNSLASFAVTMRTIYCSVEISLQIRTCRASEVKKTAGVFSENALLGAMYYLIWYMLASHITGSVWYLLAIERNGTCWKDACKEVEGCNTHFLYCGNSNKHRSGYDTWRNISETVLRSRCFVEGDASEFNYGIFSQAIQSDIVASVEVFPKFCYCLWWGLQNLSTLGQGLLTSTYPGEVMFSIVIAIMGLILFALLIGNMQTYLQSMSVRLEEMRIQRRDSEQWMHHRLLPPELRERVRRYEQYKWLNTRGVDEESLVQSLPKDLRRDIKRHLCLNLVRRVPLFANMDERLLDAICERLKPSLYTEGTYIVREGDPVNEMHFIIRGRLESVTTDGGRSGFFNRGLLKEADFCGEELLTWALDPKSAASLPTSTRTVKAINEVEAFALEAEELKFVASQFRHIRSRQVQHTFRFYSQQWRTWAAIYIQAAWRRHCRRKIAEHRRREEEEFCDSDYENSDDSAKALVRHRDTSFSSSKPGLGTTIYASRFAANALRGHRLCDSSSREMIKLQKPPEPDFGDIDDN
ncbi:hypothetical protein JHK82_017327 [Glycine max]|nr:hypothetical protein JHK82_017327 [Glycine max]